MARRLFLAVFLASLRAEFWTRGVVKAIAAGLPRQRIGQRVVDRAAVLAHERRNIRRRREIDVADASAVTIQTPGVPREPVRQEHRAGRARCALEIGERGPRRRRPPPECGGRAMSGEGLVGFAWAFLRAGAKRVVAGLWDVDDRSTAALMDALYGDWRPAIALPRRCAPRS
jgi:hypothetical protein